MVWSYAPTSGSVRITVSISAKIARISASLSGLSQTTTRLGVLEDARTSPQAPFSRITQGAVDCDNLSDFPARDTATFVGALHQLLHQPVQHGVFLGIGAIG